MPSPGMGHIIPLSELAKLFVLRHGFTATFIVFSDFSDHAQTAFLDSLPSGFSYVVIPPLPLDDLPPDADMVTRLSAMVERSVPHVRDVLRSLRRTTRLAAFVIDLFCGETLPVAKELGVPHYLLFTNNFMVLSLLWLDEQPPGSVLFVSFGSGETLSMEQIQEQAWGLEASGRRFLWVVRCPSDRVGSGAFFHLQGPDDPLRFLPEGFLERTRGAGLVVPLWAPQVEVLAHAATGGFLTHCGWNSLLESFVHGDYKLIINIFIIIN
ncbi:Hydroquinone [Musa troglodytarum]|uniref:Hydroquinone n=1 Tax=Musa troglodytarum TaxID=320322 RepID=A0A9E7HWK0_9LILI|nr:Hydroquinone [Musa troglodytarum]